MKKAQLFTVFAAFILVVFVFQNCSAPLPQDEEGSQSGSSTLSKANFAFDTEVDQLAYMSCHQLGTNFDRSSYFTFRVGAYQPGSGLGLSSSFLQHLTSVPQVNWKSELVSSAANAGAQPLLSVRDSSNAQAIYLPTSSAPSAGIDHAKMLGVLTENYLADELLKDTSQRLRYKRTAAPEGVRFEGDLNMNFGVNGLNILQTSFNNGALLAVNYPVRASNVVSIRAPAQYSSSFSQSSATTQVYGKGLRLQFRRHPSSSSGTAPTWALATVGEENMELPLNSSNRFSANKMDCPNSLVFRIVDRRHLTPDVNNTDTTKIYCEMRPDNPIALSSADRELLRRARLSLRVEDWFIDWGRKCIVPKKFDSNMNQCYGSSSSTVPVEYDLAKSCAESPAVNTVRACVALASICIR